MRDFAIWLVQRPRRWYSLTPVRGGRCEWFRVARSELEAHRARQAQPIPRDREDRLLGTLQRFEENQRVELAASEAYERWRATARDTKPGCGDLA